VTEQVADLDPPGQSRRHRHDRRLSPPVESKPSGHALSRERGPLSRTRRYGDAAASGRTRSGGVKKPCCAAKIRVRNYGTVLFRTRRRCEKWLANLSRSSNGAGETTGGSPLRGVHTGVRSRGSRGRFSVTSACAGRPGRRHAVFCQDRELIDQRATRRAARTDRPIGRTSSRSSGPPTPPGARSSTNDCAPPSPARFQWPRWPLPREGARR
jgi:hypothetical protein